MFGCTVLLALAVGSCWVVQQAPMVPGTAIVIPADQPATPVHAHALVTPSAATNHDGPGWETLTTPQKLALFPLANRWKLLSNLQKRRWLALAQGFAGLPPDEQERLHGRMTEWASLSAQQRNQARLNYAITSRLTPQDKRSQWDAYQALSEEEKRQLAARAAAKPQGVAPALRPVSPKKLAKIPAATNAPGHLANPPKVSPSSGVAARIAAPGPLAPDSRAPEPADNAGSHPPAPAPVAPAATHSASPPSTPDAPAGAPPENLYLN